MNLQLERLQLDSDVTIGSLSVDGAFECWTLEDTVRPAGVKVPGATAIPAGVYVVVITYSPHFKRDLPEVLAVPNFSGIRIHPGNTPADTEGCVLVGTDRLRDRLGRSRLAFDALFYKLMRAKCRGERITLEVA